MKQKTTKAKKPTKPKEEKYAAFISAILDLGIAMPKCSANGGELMFAKEFGREWRTDYLFENNATGIKLAVEIEGGTWKNGAHNRGSGFVKNVQKYNAYVMLGYTLLRFTTQQALKKPMECAKWVKSVLCGTIDAELMQMSKEEIAAQARVSAKAKIAREAKKAKEAAQQEATTLPIIQKVVQPKINTSGAKKSRKPENQIWLDLFNSQNDHKK